MTAEGICRLVTMVKILPNIDFDGKKPSMDSNTIRNGSVCDQVSKAPERSEVLVDGSQNVSRRSLIFQGRPASLCISWQY